MVVEEDNYLIPEWSIAVIVIGLTALLFMLIFGIVLVSNHPTQAAKKQEHGPNTMVSADPKEQIQRFNANVTQLFVAQLFNVI